VPIHGLAIEIENVFTFETSDSKDVTLAVKSCVNSTDQVYASENVLD
jgi:hypothetical protein